MDSFYKLPLNISKLTSDGYNSLPRCSEKESIDGNIELLFITCPGEHKFDLEYGCRIWELDFERIVSERKWEEDFSLYLTDAINRYETRLYNVQVRVLVSEITLQDAVEDTTMIKKKVDVFVSAMLVSTNEPCRFRYKIFLGPISSE